MNCECHENMRATFPEMLQTPSGGEGGQLSLERTSDTVTQGGPEPSVPPFAPHPIIQLEQEAAGSRKKSRCHPQPSAPQALVSPSPSPADNDSALRLSCSPFCSCPPRPPDHHLLQHRSKLPPPGPQHPPADGSIPFSWPPLGSQSPVIRSHHSPEHFMGSHLLSQREEWNEEERWK